MPLPKDPLKYENDMFDLLAAIAEALKYTSAAKPLALELKFNTLQKARNVRFRIHSFMRALEKELATRSPRPEVEIYREDSRACAFALFRVEGSSVRILDRRYNTSPSTLGNVLTDVEKQLSSLRSSTTSEEAPPAQELAPPTEEPLEYPSSIVVDED